MQNFFLLHHHYSPSMSHNLLFYSSGHVKHSGYDVPVGGRRQRCCDGGLDGWCRADPGSSQRRYQHRHEHQDGPDGQQRDGPGPQPIWGLGWPEPAGLWEGAGSVAVRNVQNIISPKKTGGDKTIFFMLRYRQVCFHSWIKLSWNEAAIRINYGGRVVHFSCYHRWL